MKKIKLTQGQFALVDDYVFDWLNQWKWQARLSKDTNSYYALRGEYLGRKDGKGIQRSILMQRMVLGSPVGKFVDHINHDTLDNRRSNLRIVSRSQNKMNSRKYKTNSSGFKGVHLRGDINKWCARIGVAGRRIHLGFFERKNEAAIAYNEAAKKYHGEYALITNI